MPSAARFSVGGCSGAGVSRAARTGPQSSPPTMPRRRMKILSIASTSAPSNWVRFAEMEPIQMLPPRQVGKPPRPRFRRRCAPTPWRVPRARLRLSSWARSGLGQGRRRRDRRQRFAWRLPGTPEMPCCSLWLIIALMQTTEVYGASCPFRRAGTERSSPLSSPPDLRQIADRRKPRPLAFSDVCEDCTVISGTRRPSCRAPSHRNQVSRTSTRDRIVQLDLPTLMMMGSFASACAGVVLLVAWWQNRKAPALALWDSAISSTRLAFSACWSVRCFTGRS
jgi:hypothetical protein